MSNTIKFAKRMDLWREYRDEINRASLKIGNSLTNDKRFIKIVNQINTIDPAILTNLNDDVELTDSLSFKTNLSTQYNALNFAINSLDTKLLNEISSALEEANKHLSDYYLINEDGKLSEASLEKFKIQDQNLIQIEARIDEIEKRIQKFPQTATNDLTALNSVLEKIKIKLKEQTFANQVSTAKITDSTDWKKLYFISLITIIVALLGCVITTVIFLTI